MGYNPNHYTNYNDDYNNYNNNEYTNNNGYNPYQGQQQMQGEMNGMGMSQHESRASLNGDMMRGNFAGADNQSVRSLQPNVFMNRYEDDCLYMNLEEEYLHKVSKRMGKDANISINKSMYNFT